MINIALSVLFQMLSQSDEKAFMKSLRILSFQMKVVNALVRDFRDHLGDCVPDLHRLLLYLNRCVYTFLGHSSVYTTCESLLCV